MKRFHQEQAKMARQKRLYCQAWMWRSPGSIQEYFSKHPKNYRKIHALYCGCRRCRWSKSHDKYKHAYRRDLDNLSYREQLQDP